jgi:hypothetical protein
MSFPLVKETTHLWKKTHVTHPVNKKKTCAELSTAISKKIQTLYRGEVCQTSIHIVCQVQLPYHILIV